FLQLAKRNVAGAVSNLNSQRVAVKQLDASQILHAVVRKAQDQRNVINLAVEVAGRALYVEHDAVYSNIINRLARADCVQVVLAAVGLDNLGISVVAAVVPVVADLILRVINAVYQRLIVIMDALVAVVAHCVERRSLNVRLHDRVVVVVQVLGDDNPVILCNVVCNGVVVGLVGVAVRNDAVRSYIGSLGNLVGADNQ